MLITYFDDCNHGERKFFGRLGVAFADEKILQLENEFRSCLAYYKVPIDDDSIDIEVKWSPPRGNWIRENLNADGRIALYRDLLTLIKAAEGLVIGCIFDYGSIKDWDLDEARRQAYIHTFERINFLAAKRGETALVITDNDEDKRTTKERVSETFSLVKKGTPYLELDRIYKHSWPVESERHAGIQLADLLCGVVTHMVAGSEEYAGKYWDLVRGQFMFFGDPNIPQRFGLSILPSPLRDHFVARCDPYNWYSK